MPLVNLVGDVGTGKTTYTTDIALKAPEEIEVLSNYEIKRENAHLMNPEDLVDKNNCIIILDEGYTWLESRLSAGKAINEYLSYLLFQSRKSNNWFYTTDQLLETIDLRFRLMANYQIDCDYIGDFYNPTGFKYRVCKLSRYRRPIVTTWTLPIEYCKKNIFPYYNTYQKISSIDSEMMDKITVDRKIIAKKVDEIVEKMLKNIPAHEWTLRTVEAYCLDNEIPQKKAKFVYNKIKAIELMNKYKKV